MEIKQQNNQRTGTQRWTKIASLCLFILLLHVPVSCAKSEWVEHTTYVPDEALDKKDKLYADGPYLFYEENNQLRSISVSPQLEIVDETIDFTKGAYTFPVYAHKGKYLFDVPLRPDIQRPPYELKQAQKVFITSDPHGDWDSFADLLVRNKVIDADYRWIYGQNQLVVIGDIFDRGKDVLPLLWLMYKLDEEASQAGGQALFLLGNHEPMVIGGDLRYVKSSYLNLAKKLDVSYEKLFGPTSVLGDWLSTRNTMHLIGKNLIVHAGISKALIEKGYTIDQVNQTMSEGLFYHKSYRKKQSEDLNFLYGDEGPIWYRGMVKDKEKYNPIDAEGVDEVLAYFDVDRLFVGHTIFKEVSSFYGNKVIAVNVKNKENKEKGRSRAILIQNEAIYIVSDQGLLQLK